MANFNTCAGSTVNNELLPHDSDAKTLYVIAHGIGRSVDMQRQLIDRITALSDENVEKSAIWAPVLPWAGKNGTISAFGDLKKTIQSLRVELDTIWSNGSFDRIVLIGKQTLSLVFSCPRLQRKWYAAILTRRDGMLIRLQPVAGKIWLWWRSRSFFVQCLLVVPILCAVAFTMLVGNMGLALSGGAIALSGPVVGWVGGVIALVLGKAASIIWRDKRRSR